MPFDAVIELSALNGTTGFRINGVAGGDWAGWSVASAGDINNDGIDDFLIGARQSGGSGAAYVVFGNASGFASPLSLSSLNGTNGFRIGNGEANQRFGHSVASAGDVNGDGIDDLIVGAWGAGGNTGVSYVVFGSSSAFASNLVLSTLDGTNGFRISGVAASDHVGWSVASAGDVNNDGVDDLIVSGFRADPNGTDSGSTYVVFGRDASVVGKFTANLSLGSLNGSNGFRIDGASAVDNSGWSVASAGDVNGDGVGDMIIGAYYADPNGTSSGASYVVFGNGAGFGATLSLSALTGANGFRISGEAAGDRNGYSVASAGDVNGDGIDDVIVGSRTADTNGADSGASYVVFGRNTAVDGAFGSNINLSTLNGTTGFRISGGTAGDWVGTSVSSAGDINGDGISDLIIGARRDDPNATDAGASFVVFGSTAGFGANLDLSTLDGTNGFRINGVLAGDESGRSVAAAGDVNGDGVDDLIVGVPYADPNGVNSGTSYVIFGRATAVTQAGTAGADAYNGGAGGDQLSGQSGDDTLNGLNGDDVLDGGDGKDALYGGAGADDLVGGLGGDLLDGGIGADQMAGGAGNDTYVVDNAADAPVELAGQGSDRVRATVSYVLGAEIENLSLEGTTDINGTGNGLANVLDGNSGANTLSGGDGADLIRGGAGADILNGGTGVDQLIGGIGADNLDGADDNDRLEGGDGNDTILGGTGADILDGGADNDSLAGGTGADQLLGGAGTDTLDGGDGNDILNGGLGADAMTGGAGDDVFLIDDAGDTTIEAAGQGIDQVRAGISVTLSDNIETLILEGVGNLDGTGNGLANTLNGNNGDNVLDGAAGNDLIKGGLGADTLIGGTGNDILVGGGGNDSFIVRQASVYSSLVPGGQTLEVDTVSDYATGDRIDLSTIDAVAGGTDDAFTLVSAFDGQLGRMVLSFASGTTTLTLDVDGDRKADYTMRINGDVRADTGGWLL